MLGNPRVAHWLPARIPLLILPWAIASPHKAPLLLHFCICKGMSGWKAPIPLFKVLPDQMTCRDDKEHKCKETPFGHNTLVPEC